MVVPCHPRSHFGFVLPTLNEASNLPRCLDHLQWADEVVVVDSGSTDATNAIAEAYGAKVIQFKWNGAWPMRDLIVLLSVATMLWISAGAILARRDLATL